LVDLPKTVRRLLPGFPVIFTFCFAFTSFFPSALNAQNVKSPLERRLIEQGFVDVQTLDPSIMVDLKYARPDNFMEADVYGDLTHAFLLPEAAKKLVLASEILQARHPGLRILVADALRPRVVQHKMWKIVSGTPMQPYVANPYSGSMHNYGAAVDVTLYDVRQEKILDMGTPIDYFGPLAQPQLESEFLRQGKLSREQLDNRRILRSIMLEAGWQMINIEWWHFDAFPIVYTRQNYTIIE
jgi:zinc D-Ala-D-Ala dipeptidase